MMSSPRLLVVLTVLWTGPGMVSAVESTDRSPSDPPTARKSHIQPVGEMAAASRSPDTLGLQLSRASEVLRQQLALGRGAGLVVEDVVAGSVAEKAGFKRHDVLVLLDDQMLLLPEQLTALLEASDGRSVPQCTVLRGGAKVTIPLGRSEQAVATRTAVPPPAPVRPTLPLAPREPQTVQQTAAKPATASRLRTPASALALAQAGQQPGQTITKTSAATPAASLAAAPGQPADEVLLRQDPDYQIKVSRGNETRLVVLDPRGRIVFNDAIETPEQRSLIPQAVRQRVEEMERSLESAARAPVLEVGRLDVEPIEIR
ncbi:MAG: hypothetical protein RLZZ111_2302 [Planctomycetota bacterium]